MSRRKVAYAKKNCIDPEEEGEELPFEPREINIQKGKWVTTEFEILELLGRGKFGEVKKCSENCTGLKLAAKFITMQCDSDVVAVKREVDIQSKLHHTKILQVYAAYEKERKMCIVLELVEGGELFDRVVDPNFDLTERVAILFMRQIVDAMSFIHSQNVLHLDMKPENVVCVAKTGTRIKIIDFGLALRYSSGCGVKTMAGTLEFMAPEVANFEDVTPATDMWSIGVICYVLVSGLSPFLGKNDNETTTNILRTTFDFNAEEFEAITDGCKDFIKQLLVKDPRKRLTASDCMKHGWLQKITRAQTTRHLSKKFHVRLFARRKWKKAIKAIVAMNRLEHFSSGFMKKKTLSNASLLNEPTTNKEERKRSHTMPSNTDTKYDWRANMAARKKQRELEKSQSKNVDDTPSSRSRGNHNSIEPRVGRISIHDRSDYQKPVSRVSDRDGTTTAGRDRGSLDSNDHSLRVRNDRENRTGSSPTPRRRSGCDSSALTATATPSRQSRLAALTGRSAH